MAQLEAQGATAFAMDCIPRLLSRGQTFDALSSQVSRLEERRWEGDLTRGIGIRGVKGGRGEDERGEEERGGEERRGEKRRGDERNRSVGT